MYSDDLMMLGFIALAAFIFGGIGLLMYLDFSQQHLVSVECIKAGKAMIEGSCVKLAP